MTTQAIDVMNYGAFAAPGLSGPEYQSNEYQSMIRTTFRALVKDGMVTTPFGRQIPADGKVELDPTPQVEATLASMDASDTEAVVLACIKMWSYYSHHQLIWDIPEEAVAKAVAEGGGRLIGAAGYNPLRISDSLRTIEAAVRDHGFKLVYFHPITFGVAPNDRRCYPLYAKCVELGIPVSMQVGHSAEPLPSIHGHPMLVDEVAIEFPELRINLSHTGWPWTGEFISVLWRHENVYGDISAYFPSSLDPELVKAMDGQIRNKVMLGTNGLDMNRVRRELEALPLREKSLERIIRQNALEFLGL